MPTSDPTRPPEGSGQGEVSPRDVVLTLSRAINIAQTYAADHPMRRESVRLMARLFGPDGALGKDMLLMCVGSRLIVNGRSLDTPLEGVDSLHNCLKRRWLRGISLPPAVTDAEAEALLGLMTARPEDIEEAGGPSAFLRGKSQTGRIALLEIAREGAVGEIDEGESRLLRDIVSRVIFEDDPFLEQEELALVSECLSNPQSIARVLSIASEVLRRSGAGLPQHISAIGVLESMYERLEKMGMSIGRALRTDVADAMQLLDENTARGFLREKLLRDPDPGTIVGSDLETPAKTELARIVVENDATGSEIPSALMNSVSRIFPGESGRQKLAALLHGQFTALGSDAGNALERVTEMLEGISPLASSKDPRRQYTEDALSLIDTIAAFDYDKRYTYVLLELTLLARDMAEMAHTVEPLLEMARQALKNGEYAVARDIVSVLDELASGRHKLPTEAAAYARKSCRLIATSDSFMSSIGKLDDEALHNADEVWDILAAVRSHIADWLLDRVVSCTDSEISWKFSHLLTGIQDQIGPKLRRKLEGVHLSQAEALFHVLYRTDKEGFLRLCETHLQDRHVGDGVDVVQALGKLGDPDVVGVLRTALASPSAWLRQETVHALGRVGGEEAAGVLRGLATRGSRFGLRHEMRRAAVESLGISRDPVAVPMLVRMLRKKLSLVPRQNRELRLQAAIALGSIGTEEAVQALREASGDRNPDIQQVCTAAVLRIETNSQD